MKRFVRRKTYVAIAHEAHQLEAFALGFVLQILVLLFRKRNDAVAKSKTSQQILLLDHTIALLLGLQLRATPQVKRLKTIDRFGRLAFDLRHSAVAGAIGAVDVGSTAGTDIRLCVL